MATLGKLHEFKPDEEEFATYLERVEIFFAANGVEDTKKVPVFLRQWLAYRYRDWEILTWNTGVGGNTVPP